MKDTKCDCGCHTSPSSDDDMKKNGCDLCCCDSDYYPRHPRVTKDDICTMDELKEDITTQLCYLADFETDEESLNAAEGHAEIIMSKIKVFIKNQDE